MPAPAEPLHAAEPVAVPLWFGPPERRAFGWVHRPVGGRARSVLVMCSSLGQEAHFAHYAYRCIAQALARRDVLVIRFDYCGTGDAHDVAVPGDELARWSAGVDDAIALARELTDAPLQLLGLRAGTFLALHAAARHQDVRGLVLWDVPRSGKTWMRELLARHNVAVGAEEGHGFTALGLTLNRATVKALRANDLRGVGEIASDRVLLLQRPDTRPALRRATARGGRPLERTEAPEQGPFLAEQAVPTRTMATITSWVADGAATGPTHPVRPTPLAGQHLGDGFAERTVWLGRHRMFGIVTEPTVPRSSTRVVFVPDAFTPHSGLSRIWTDQARAWARQGIESVRFDVSGCGDSDPWPGREGHRRHVVEHIHDTAEVLQQVDPTATGDIVLVGLSSGAYHATEVALRRPVRAIAMVNPMVSFAPPETPTSPDRLANEQTRPTLSRLVGRIVERRLGPMAGRYGVPEDYTWADAMAACHWKRSVYRGLGWVPETIWWLLGRLVLSRPPDRVVRRLVERGTDVLWVTGPDDWRLAALGAHHGLRRLERDGGLRVVHLDRLDHSMRRGGAKLAVTEALTPFVLGHVQELRTQPTTLAG